MFLPDIIDCNLNIEKPISKNVLKLDNRYEVLLPSECFVSITGFKQGYTPARLEEV